MRKRNLILSSIITSISGLLGIIGISGICCTLTGAAIISFLGIASFSTFVVYNNKWFLFISILFMILTFILYFEYKFNKNCPNKKKNVNNIRTSK